MIHSVIFDWKQTLYDPDDRVLIKGAIEVLDHLKKNNTTLYLVGKGADDMHEEVDRLKVRPYFSDINFVNGDKHPDHFKKYVNQKNPKTTLVIGDKLSSEIEVGNLIGATTIQIRQGKFASDTPERKTQEPDMVVFSLVELIPVLIANRLIKHG